MKSSVSICGPTLNLNFIFIGKTKEKYLADGIADFQKRLGRYSPVHVKIIKERRGKFADQVKIREEGEQLLAQVPAGSFIIALDRTGKQVDSEGLAQLCGRWLEQNRQHVTFLIGGPLGLAHGVTRAADLVLSMSKMTFTHEMARLLLMEQVYRAFNILSGTRYHK